MDRGLAREQVALPGVLVALLKKNTYLPLLPWPAGGGGTSRRPPAAPRGGIARVPPATSYLAGGCAPWLAGGCAARLVSGCAT